MTRAATMSVEKQNLRRGLAEARLQAIYNSGPECIKILDSRARLIDMNQAGLTMIEADSLDQVVGCDVAEIVAPSYRKHFLDGIERVMRGEEVRQQFEIVGLNGTRRWMDQIAVPLYAEDGSGEVLEVVAITRDMTELATALKDLEEARDRAESANRLKSNFLANMSHEIRTPLNGVLGVAQLLERTPVDETQQSYLQTIKKSGNALLSVINDILNISELEAGGVALIEDEYVLDELLQGAVDTVSSNAQLVGLNLSWDCTIAKGSRFIGDPAKINQVLLNFLGNAIKFTASGSIKLNVGLTSCDSLFFQVTDTGPGIPTDCHESVFLRFAQHENNKQRHVEGTGLGLAISKALVELMGGEIGVESVPNVGSTFWFKIPAKQCGNVPLVEQATTTPIETPSTASEENPTSGRLRILLAEDHEVNREIVFQTFKHMPNIEITPVENGLAAIEALEHQTFDVVLMDIAMPVMSGDEAIKTIRASGKSYRDVPIIVVSANALPEQEEAYLALGIDGLLSKPYNLDDLMETISHYTDDVDSETAKV